MALFIFCCLLLPLVNGYALVDLSYPQQSDTLYWPGVTSFSRSVLSKGENDHGIWIEVGVYTTGEHGGTHIDVPRHFYNTSWDLKDFPLERTIAEGVMIDCKAEAAANPDYAVTAQKLQDWEKVNGRIPNQAAVLINFGWTDKWTDPKKFLGSNTIGDPNSFHFPFMHVKAAQWLVRDRDVKIVGLDIPSPDSPRDQTFPCHTTFLSRNIMVLENVMIPETLPPRNFRLHAAPIKIKDGTGTQTRIYAMLYDNLGGGASSSFAFLSALTSSLVLTATFYNIYF